MADDATLEEVSKKIRKHRTMAGLSQQELADRTGLQVRYIRRVETTPTNVSLLNLIKLAKGLDVAVTELIPDERTPASKKRAGSSVSADCFRKVANVLMGLALEHDRDV